MVNNAFNPHIHTLDTTENGQKLKHHSHTGSPFHHDLRLIYVMDAMCRTLYGRGNDVNQNIIPLCPSHA